MFSFSPVDDPIRAVLDANVRHFSNFVAFATAAVAIGVTLEGIEIVHAIVEWGKRRRRNKRDCVQFIELSEMLPVGELRQTTQPHFEEPKWVKLLLRIGIILVVGGVVGEFRYGTKLEDAHDAVHLYDLRQIAAARDAQRRVDIALYNRSWTIRPLNRDGIKLLSGSSPARCEVLYVDGDPETYIVAEAIFRLLKNEVHWDCTGPTGEPVTKFGIGGLPWSGVTIEDKDEAAGAADATAWIDRESSGAA
ncbi:MAG: hypothetical protein WA604_08665, partial [Candidatus Sulfotelmatobacter sp.]